MLHLHLCNAHFEEELAAADPRPPLDDLRPICRQLQFLPFLYASSEEGVALSRPPPEGYLGTLKALGITPPKAHLVDSDDPLPYQAVDPWGHAPSIAKWAHARQIAYSMPPWDSVRLANSKEFSFRNTPSLPGAELLWNDAEARRWLASQPGPAVFKTCFGVSGRGHILSRKMTPLMHAEWAAGRPIIGEPWVERLLDFSSQWILQPSGACSLGGLTGMTSDDRGAYKASRIGFPFDSFQAYVDEHLEHARSILDAVALLGYWGNVGVDSMVYTWKGRPRLHPIVEVNARKTMGWVALQIQKRHFPGKALTIAYEKGKSAGIPLLPPLSERQLCVCF
jgi:hypothetical protein